MTRAGTLVLVLLAATNWNVWEQAHPHTVVAAVQQALPEGIPVLGYCHSSLTDNYEWGTYTPRFGLYTVDALDRAAPGCDAGPPAAPSGTAIELRKEPP
jgi:hypothetical protein